MTTSTSIADVATKISGVTNRGTWTSTPTSSGKVTIPAGYHNGSGYVDTSKLNAYGADTSGEAFLKLIYGGSYFNSGGYGAQNGHNLARSYNLNFSNIASFSYKVEFSGYAEYFKIFNDSDTAILEIYRTTDLTVSQTVTGTFNMPTNNVSKCRLELSSYGAGQYTNLYITSYTKR